MTTHSITLMTTRKSAVLAALVAAIVCAPTLALASIETGCGSTLQNAAFQATFAWQGVGTAKARKMEIRIGKRALADTPVAQIREAGRCVAVCSIRTAVPAPAEPSGRAPTRSIAAVSFPDAIDMDCQSPELNGLASPASLIFRSASGEPSVLRFGSWLSGYKDARLDVKRDRLASLD